MNDDLKELHITEWFDVRNKNHLAAYKYLHDHGEWPKDFLPKTVAIEGNWVADLNSMLAATYILEKCNTPSVLATTDNNNGIVERLSEIKLVLEEEGDNISNSRSRIDSLLEELDVVLSDLECMRDDVENVDDTMQEGVALLEDAIAEIESARERMEDI